MSNEDIHKSEEAGIICKRQLGSRKMKMTQTPILLEMLRQDYSRTTAAIY
jgi:hypothetical protein